MNKIKSSKGQALILIAFAVVGLVGFTALAIDGGMVFSDRRHAQNAADTAAFAAALAKIRASGNPDVTVQNAAAEAAAVARAASNGYDDNGTTNEVEVHSPPISGDFSCANNPSTCNDYIQVIITSYVKTTFARVVGREVMKNVVDAVARATTGSSSVSGGGSGYGITALKQGCAPNLEPIRFTGSGNRHIQGGIGDNGCFKNTGSGIFEITGDLEISDRLDDSGSSDWIVGGNAWVNGYTKTGSGSWDVTGSFYSNAGFSTTGSAQYVFGTFSVAGSYSKNGSADVNIWPPTVVSATTPPVLPDPFVSVLNPPANPGGCVAINYSGSTDHTLNPGCYTNISQSGSGNLTLNAGVYYISTGSLTSSGTGDITANGVMIYLAQGAFGMNGSGDINITPMTSGPYAGLSVFMDRANSNAYTMTGSGSCNFTGTIYAPASSVTITGSGGTFVVDSQIISSRAELTGSGDLNLVYNPANNYNPNPADPPAIELAE